LLTCAVVFAQAPVIFDTDMGNDIDDALALALLHALETRGDAGLSPLRSRKTIRGPRRTSTLSMRFMGGRTFPSGW